MDRTIWYWNIFLVVGVAQVVEHRVVAPVVEGSNPFTHPILFLPRIFTETSQIQKKSNPAFSGIKLCGKFLNQEYICARSSAG